MKIKETYIVEENSVFIKLHYCLNLKETNMKYFKEYKNGIIVRKNGKVLITHNSSPMEHCARAMDNEEYRNFVKGNLKGKSGQIAVGNSKIGWCNNIKGFIPLRYFIDNSIKY